MDGAVPAVCPTCGTPIPQGRAQCPGCKRVFGEDNRCPSCHAIAAVRPVGGGGTLCVACGKPRELLPGTTVQGGDALPAALRVAGTAPLRARAVGDRAGAATLRLLGGASIGGGVLAAGLVAATIAGPVGLVAAAVVGLSGILTAVFAFRAARRRAERAEAAEHAARELAVLALAEKHAGTLTATDVARALGVGTDEADATLTRMAKDGERVGVDVDDQGVVHYVFRELRGAAVPQVRVEEAAEPAELPRDEASKDAKRART